MLLENPSFILCSKWAFNQSKLLASLGWRNFFHYHQHPHSVQPSISNISHPKAQYLHYLACSGAPAFFPNTDWSAHALTRYMCGPHQSVAMQYASFLMEDMYHYIQMGYWVVLPYNAVKLPSLCLAPEGVVS